LDLLSSGLHADATRSAFILVSLTFAATIFRTGAMDTWYVLYNFVSVIFIDLPRAIIDIASSSYSCGHFVGQNTQFAGPDCFIGVGSRAANSIRQFFTHLLQGTRSVIDVLQFFAAWTVLAWVLYQPSWTLTDC
jgi:hypothetical protein